MTTQNPTPPRWLKPMNKVFLALQRLGLGMRELPVLTVPGRKSGKPRSTPLSVLEHEGQRYLLEGFPGADWARNVRAAGGRATLSTGKRREEVRLVELDRHDALPVLRLWPVRLADGAKIMADAGVVEAVTPEAFEKVAGRCGVFRVETA
ncbi:nitroreductase/quinone reductase family protein [Pseudonocardia cypriaca]|uniref:Deazaflavin-dependent oxidoreductase (Nitroreductase family) n=1 Tax=Pseudonocardia cypriaca TaxID=882449 RepID=A0A543GHE2_9PSEU|nr:nitroreductase/quinone reductase family protein [Pseudonocardia cypriaca]TQM45501.1 deazaflavin-dependent oxidoreductase (nitroreductase family) [Pseudonocardia cypriaca]